MKKLIFLCAVLSTFFLSSCENDYDGCLEVKVISELCGTAVLQVVGGPLPDGVANTWTDANNNTYQNVFTTFLDGCDPNYPEQGATFFVKIVDEQPVSECGVCLALLADAPEEYLYTVITPECGVDSGNF